MELRTYQKTVVEQARLILAQYGIVYLALETRTGKTIISLTLASHFDLPVLFVTKKKAIPSIQKDYNASGFTYPIEIINFEMLKNQKYSHRVIIIDEAHGCGAFPKPALRAKFLRKITDKNPVILLSATPTPESLSQIFHQLWCANAHLQFIYRYDSFYKWAKDYVLVKQKRIGTGQFVNDYSHGITAKINPEVNSIMVTLTQKEAMFTITDLYETREILPMPMWMREIYTKLKKDGVAEVRGHTVVADSAVSRMSKTHQLCGGTILSEDGAVILSAYKIPRVQRLYEQMGKIAVYYKFIAEGELMKRCFPDDVILDWQEFQKAERGIYLSQFQSGREGINLSTAKAIICFNVDHAYLSYEQTKNRLQEIHRQEKGKLIYLCSDTGFEDSVLNVVQQKKNFTSVHFRQYERKIKETI